MRRIIIPLVTLLVLVGAILWWNQPERVLARRVTGLFKSATVAADAGNITRGLRGSAIEGYLAPDISFSGPEGPTEMIGGAQSRDSVVALYTSLARYCRRVSLPKPEIDAITLDGEEASVEARLDAVIELKDGNFPVDGIQHLTMGWHKIDGKWRLASVAWRETGR